MDLPKLFGENSGKSNPIVNLASHATQDYAFQDQIGLPSASSQLENEFPQTFRMNDLINEVQNIGVQSNTPATKWPNEYRNDWVQNNASTHQEAIWAQTNGRMQHQHDAFPQFYPQFGITTQKTFYPNNQMHFENCERYPYHPHPLQTHNYFQPNEQLEETLRIQEELAKLQVEVKESQREYIDDFEKINRNNNKSSKKVNEEEKKKKKVFYFDGLGVEEVFHAPTPDVEWSEAENFYLFVINNRKKLMNFDLHIEKKFKFTENNPYMDIDDPLSQGLQCYREGDYSRAILFYEAAVQKDKHCVIGWQQLIFSLRNDDRDLEAIYLIKESLPLEPDYFSRVLYSIFISEQYYYQGCQIILQWLKGHPHYRDLVPPNFTLEDKTSNMIEQEPLEALQKILIKAAQRSPFNPDYYIQSALCTLLETSRDYSKANDCRLYLSKCDPTLWKACELVVGINLLRNNEPYKAISYFNELKLFEPIPLFRSHCEHGLGLTYMFLKNYKNAGKCLLTGLHISKMTYNILWLDLLLCTKLMKRNDLINLVNNRDFHQLCKEFDYQTNTTATSVFRKIQKRSNRISSSKKEKNLF